MNKPERPLGADFMNSKKLPPIVIVLSFVSFFNDFASDIVISLIPILLTTVFAAGPIALGFIEGVAEAIASFLKSWSGRHSDVMNGRRKGLTLASSHYQILLDPC